MVANHLHIRTFSRDGQRANLCPLAHAAKQRQRITFWPLIRVPGPGCLAKDNPPARLARLQKLLTVSGRRFRGMLNLHQVGDWSGSIGNISTNEKQFLSTEAGVILRYRRGLGNTLHMGIQCRGNFFHQIGGDVVQAT